MVDLQLIARGITDQAVLAAMRTIPRHEFVPEAIIDRAYADCALPIGEGQTISQPYMVALMTQSLGLDKHLRALEIGAGTGYQAAVLSEVCREVVAIERIAVLAERARHTLKSLHYKSIEVITGDGAKKLSRQYSNFDGIMISAAIPEKPEYLFSHLVDRGRLVAPVGNRHGQMLYIYTKSGDMIDEETVCGCTYVPLIGEYGWTESKSSRP